MVAPQLWNSVPSEVGIGLTLYILRGRLKTHFLAWTFEGNGMRSLLEMMGFQQLYCYILISMLDLLIDSVLRSYFDLGPLYLSMAGSKWNKMNE